MPARRPFDEERAATFWKLHEDGERRLAKLFKDQTARDLFVGVVVNAGAAACEAAQSLEGQVFPYPRRPALPLAACDRAVCACSLIARSKFRR